MTRIHPLLTKPPYLTVEHPCWYRWRARRWRRQRCASGEVPASAHADAGTPGVEVVAVEVQEPQEEGSRVHLAGLLLEIPGFVRKE